MEDDYCGTRRSRERFAEQIMRSRECARPCCFGLETSVMRGRDSHDLLDRTISLKRSSEGQAVQEGVLSIII